MFDDVMFSDEEIKKMQEDFKRLAEDFKNDESIKKMAEDLKNTNFDNIFEPKQEDPQEKIWVIDLPIPKQTKKRAARHKI